ncbi:hypothetical protein ACFIQG_21165 [Comamonas odontotermitis]|uniref:hypothetical protein n=1 Tax=Comamonas odontotermitis TaxID=379895 RepID=UPI0036728076
MYSIPLNTSLKHLLPKRTWQILARNKIETLEQAKNAYTHNLLSVSNIGASHIRQIERILFPSCQHVSAEPEVLRSISLEDSLPQRLISILKKNQINTIEELRSAYPRDLLSIYGIGFFHLRTIEKAFFPTQQYIPQKRRGYLRKKTNNEPRIISIFSPSKDTEIHNNANENRSQASFTLNSKFSNRTINVLLRHGFKTREEVMSAYPERLLRLTGFGLNALREVERNFFPGQFFSPVSRRDKKTIIKSR